MAWGDAARPAADWAGTTPAHSGFEDPTGRVSARNGGADLGNAVPRVATTCLEGAGTMETGVRLTVLFVAGRGRTTGMEQSASSARADTGARWRRVGGVLFMLAEGP